jgi:hypothetical protein
MTGMNFKALPLMGTWLFAAAFLLSTLWHSIFWDGWGFLVSGLLFLSFVLFSCVITVTALVERTRIAGFRCLISIVTLGLFIPTMRLGGDLRNWMFLSELPTYQKITDILINQKQINPNDEVVPFPSGYSSSLLNDQHAAVERNNDGSIVVLYLTRDSSALGHSGYFYSSNADPAVIKKHHPDMGFYPIAPHWFWFAD